MVISKIPALIMLQLLIIFLPVQQNLFSGELTSQQEEDDTDFISIVLLKNRLYANRVLKLIRNSRNNIRLCMARCDYTENTEDIASKLLTELVNQSKRGIDIEVILERGNKNSETQTLNTAARNYLYKNGIKVYDDPDDVNTNANMLLVDNYIAVVGSVVWTDQSISKNNELEFWIESPEVFQMLLDKFNEIKNRIPE